MKNLSGSKQMIEHTQHQRQFVHFDDLTRLPNRALLEERLRKAIAQSKRWGQPLAVVRLRMEGLEAIRDQHGRSVSDQLLSKLARRMKRCMKKGDTLACFEEDKFAVFLTALESRQACQPTLNRLLESVVEPVQVGETLLQLSASIGVTFYPQEVDTDQDQLLRQASQAMHRARETGKNRFYFFESTNETSQGSHPESPECIRQALAAREFVLYFLPKVDMCKGKVAGAEALIRWQHPERGLLPPAEFLPIIEDHPLAVELGEWVIGAALTQMEAWLDAGLEISVSVNVGARQLQQSGFAERLASLLNKHPRIRPSSLELDILESNPPEDVGELSSLLAACRGTGVSFALDDFGASHISLIDLKRLPIDVLKVGPRFIRNILEDPDDLAILEGVLGLIAGFHRRAVAQGVETVEQGLMLLRLGCEFAQGYGIAQPMLAGEFPAWAKAWRPDPRWINADAVAVDERPLLHAGVEHRAWVATVEAFLRNETDQEPRLSRYQCQFGSWLYGEGPAGRSSLPAFQPIVALHWRIHALAAGIVKFHTQKRDEEGLARLPELKDMVDKLADLLNSFGQTSEPHESEEVACVG
jgi:diguanylate cyclase (GGDEF)-like protein